jgi:hypothetical protein
MFRVFRDSSRQHEFFPAKSNIFRTLHTQYTDFTVGRHARRKILMAHPLRHIFMRLKSPRAQVDLC